MFCVSLNDDPKHSLTWFSFHSQTHARLECQKSHSTCECVSILFYSDNSCSPFVHVDGDYLKALTERNKVTDQKGHESKSQNPVLQNLTESFEDDATGEKVDIDFANIAIKRWAKKLNPENVKGLGEKYKRPANCTDLKAVKVNKEIWSQLSAKQRKMDLQLANMQQLTRKIAFANLQTTNWLLSQPSGTDT